jgi:hypothetical protein
MIPFDHLPGGKLVEKGLADLRRGDETVEALTVAVASRRFHELGSAWPSGPLPPGRAHPVDAELRLYAALLAQDAPLAYVRYNALLRELDSFLSAVSRLPRASEPSARSRPGTDASQTKQRRMEWETQARRRRLRAARGAYLT